MFKRVSLALALILFATACAPDVDIDSTEQESGFRNGRGPVRVEPVHPPHPTHPQHPVHPQHPHDPSALAVDLDPQLAPAMQVPTLEDGEPRPAAAIVDDSGIPAVFVENELLLVDPDDALLSELGARVVAIHDPAEYGVQGPRTFLVRVEPGAFDAARLADELRAVDGRAHGQHRVSSAHAGALIGVAARAAASGRQVGLNFVAEPDGFADRTIAESPTATIGGYSPNAFVWPHMKLGGAQNIGVAEAWRALLIAGKLTNVVPVAVIDAGFQPDADFPSGTATSMIPGHAPTGTENPSSCGDGPCPYHGTNVVQVGFGIPANGFGVAGPGGPVAEVHTIHGFYDFFTNIVSITVARGRGARIINMSFSARVPASVSFSVLPFEAATRGARGAGTLLFAAAGNKGQNVDEEDCFGPWCWEEAWHTPCENDGVICVGGLDLDSKWKHAKSNHGPSVDVWGPFVVYAGATPAKPGLPRIGGGTSYSSPFVAGVAALLWAADPTHSADQVENTLYATAHASPDASVNRIVNAFGAVKAVLGNVTPTIAITAPATGTTVSYGGFNNVTLAASVDDVEDGPGGVTVTWSSDREGYLGTGATISRVFGVRGTHTITARATDSAGGFRERHISLEVVNDAPVPEILAPAMVSAVYRGAPVALLGRARDANEIELSCDKLVWTTGEGVHYGCAPTAVFSTVGWAYVTLRAVDEVGAATEAGLYLLVQEPPAGIPVVSITSPGVGGGVWGNKINLLVGTATDPDGTAIVSYEWAVIDAGVRTVLGGNSLRYWKPSETHVPTCGGRHVELELTATDAAGQVGKTSRVIFINWPVC